MTSVWKSVNTFRALWNKFQIQFPTLRISSFQYLNTDNDASCKNVHSLNFPLDYNGIGSCYINGTTRLLLHQLYYENVNAVRVTTALISVCLYEKWKVL